MTPAGVAYVMSPILALTHATGIRLAEVGFLLVLIAGVWIAASEFVGDVARWHKFRMVVAGSALAAAGVLLIIAVHWGHFG